MVLILQSWLAAVTVLFFDVPPCSQAELGHEENRGPSGDGIILQCFRIDDNFDAVP
jgi:hypothetical protein